MDEITTDSNGSRLRKYTFIKLKVRENVLIIYCCLRAVPKFSGLR